MGKYNKLHWPYFNFFNKRNRFSVIFLFSIIQLYYVSLYSLTERNAEKKNDLKKK